VFLFHEFLQCRRRTLPLMDRIRFVPDNWRSRARPSSSVALIAGNSVKVCSLPVQFSASTRGPGNRLNPRQPRTSCQISECSDPLQWGKARKQPTRNRRPRFFWSLPMTEGSAALNPLTLSGLLSGLPFPAETSALLNAGDMASLTAPAALGISITRVCRYCEPGRSRPKRLEQETSS
jgi:hypothetical protein